jgi:hypothetical protein
MAADLVGGVGFASQRAAAKPTASAARTAASQGHAAAFLVGGAGEGAAATGSIHASPMSRSRFFGSRSRQRASSERNGGGVSAGSFDQSGS